MGSMYALKTEQHWVASIKRSYRTVKKTGSCDTFVGH